MDAAPRGRVWLDAALGFALVLATGLAYGGLGQAGFVSYDDPGYVTENAHVLAGLSAEGLRWSLGTFRQGNWHPVTWWSHQLDVELFGLDPAGHHRTSLALHLASAVLVFALLRRATGARWRSALAAGLFALHPLRVESVAWIAERKDVLSAALGLLALRLWVEGTRGARIAATAAFALALGAKPMAVTLPCVLLLLDRWPLGRERALGWARLVREKAVLFAFAAASCAVTVAAQRAGGAVQTLEAVPPLRRVENAALAVVAYLRQTLWPSDLAVFYPRSGPQPLAGVAAVLAIAGATAWAQRGRERRPWAWTGWLWFLGTLVPVIGLVQVGEQARADRYTYLPSIGLALAAAWALGEVAARRPALRGALVAASLLVLGALGAATHRQVHVWHDSRTLFEHALAATGDHVVALVQLGNERRDAGALDEALPLYERALRLRPTDFLAHLNYGAALGRAGRDAEAAGHFGRALELRPGEPRASANLAAALLALGRAAEAEAPLRAALRADPDQPAARYNLALALEATGRRAEARDELRRALELDPGFEAARRLLEQLAEE